MRTRPRLARISLASLTSFVVFSFASSAFGAATIVIQNGDPPDVGFNDPTPVAPIGGNPGTTLGQQRLNAFQFAAGIRGATLNSNTTIIVRAAWQPLSCTANSAVLGTAGSVKFGVISLAHLYWYLIWRRPSKRTQRV